MRTLLLLITIGVAYAADAALGIWKMDPTHSSFMGDTKPKSLLVRIEPHVKGEVLTLDRIEADGRSTSSSTILYFDGAPHDFQDFGCSGTQSSRRLDGGDVEILRNCEGGASVRLIRRFLMSREEMIFDVTDQHTDGRRFSRHLVFNKQSATVTTSNDSDTARAPKLAANQDLHFQRGENHK
jgi:hypothetical protein